MFFPVMEEQLFITDSGEHTNGINSVAEFVDVVILNHKQKSPDSDDQPPFFHIVKAGLNYFVPLAYEMRPAVTVKPEKRHYPEYSERLLPVISAEIFVPPPEA